MPSDVERAEVSFITTRSVDRDREVVLPGGLDFKDFRKAPVVAFAHDYRQLPVGQALWVKREKNVKPEKDGWMALTQYFTRPPDHEGPWLPSSIFHISQEMAAPVLGKSIGFIPLEGRPPSPDDIRKNPEWAKARYVIAKAAVFEYSIAPVVANQFALPLALSKAKAKGFGLTDRAEEVLGVYLSDGYTPEVDEEPEPDPEPDPKPVPPRVFRKKDFCQTLAAGLHGSVGKAVDDTKRRAFGEV